MIKNKENTINKKLLFGLGGIAAVVLPVSAIASCNVKFEENAIVDEYGNKLELKPPLTLPGTAKPITPQDEIGKPSAPQQGPTNTTIERPSKPSNPNAAIDLGSKSSRTIKPLNFSSQGNYNYLNSISQSYSQKTWNMIDKIKTKGIENPEPLFKQYRTATWNFYDYVNQVDVKIGDEYRDDNRFGRDIDEINKHQFAGWNTTKVETLEGFELFKISRNGESTHYLIDIKEYTDSNLEKLAKIVESKPEIDIVSGRIKKESGLIDWSLLPTTIKKLEINMFYENEPVGNFIQGYGTKYTNNNYQALYGLGEATFLTEIELNAPGLTDIIPSSLPIGVYFQKNANLGPHIETINLSNITNLNPVNVSTELYISHVLQANNWIFQGYFYGGGGYPTNLNMEGTLINSLENIELPIMKDGRKPLKWVGMGTNIDEWEYDINKGLKTESLIQDIWYGKDQYVDKLVLVGQTTKAIAIKNLTDVVKHYPIKTIVVNDPRFKLVENSGDAFDKQIHDKLLLEVIAEVEKILEKKLPISK